MIARVLQLLALLLLLVPDAAVAQGCPGCCSSHGGISNTCASNGNIRCRDGTVSPSCRCSTCGVSGGGGTPICTGGQVPSGSTCICPLNQILVSGQCQTRVACAGGTVSASNTCSCPAGQIAVSGVCVQRAACTNGQLSASNTCICPFGQALQAGTCFTLSPATIPQTGWWWNPGESGRGFFIEQRGANIFMAGFLYDQAGNPDWFVANGPVTASNRFEATMLRFLNGQTLTGTYRAPVAGAPLGTVRLDFASPTQATMTWPGGQLPLVRFQFGGQGAGAAQNGWWWNTAESGRGFSIEIQGSTLFVAGYMYTDFGPPAWFTAAGEVGAVPGLTTGARFTGVWQSFRDGQGIGQPYRAPILLQSNAGAITITFTSATTAQLTLPNGRQILLQRFEF